MCDIHKLLRPAHKVVVLAACRSSADWRFLDQRGGGYIPASKHGACTEERRTVAQPNDVAFGDGFAEEAPIRAAQKKLVNFLRVALIVYRVQMKTVESPSRPMFFYTASTEL